MEKLDRRKMLKLGTSLGAGLVLNQAGRAAGMNLPRSERLPKSPKPLDVVRIGQIGYGSRGKITTDALLALDGVEIRAVCDIKEDRVALAQRDVVRAGQPKPQGYSRGEHDYRRLCERNDLDLVIVSTPWEWHTPMCLEVLDAGIHAACEMPIAITIDECWELVEKAEEANRYCVLLENCCYWPSAMMTLNMIRQGLFGEIVHCQGGYQHYRCFNHFDSRGNMLWRAKHAIKYDGMLYPTHPMGPIAQWMDINRGDRFDYIVSMSTASKGFNLYAAEHFGADHPSARQKYAIGDINTSMIRTVNGKSVVLYYDTQLPRPHSFIWRVQGTNGVYMEDMKQIYLKDISPATEGDPFDHRWEPISNYEKDYEHPLWTATKAEARNHGHFGADYTMMYRLIKDLRDGVPPEIDVYDAVTWSCIRPLSIDSVTAKSQPVAFPDFTKGKWKTNPQFPLRDV